MRIGFFSDAHGNLPSTLMCIGKMKELKLDRFYFLGDAIGYMPEGIEVLNLLQREQIPCILGNHEAMALGRVRIPADRDRVYKLIPLLKDMSHSQLTQIADTWPESRDITLSGKKLLLVHGRPSNVLEGYAYPDDCITPLELNGYDVIVMGHTHRPFVKHYGETVVINTGSCGLPRDIGNKPSFAIYDTGTGMAEICRYEMDVDEIIASWSRDSIHESVIKCLHRNGDHEDGR